MFKVIEQIEQNHTLTDATETFHSKGRKVRNNNIRDILNGCGEPLYFFLVDKGHKNGMEIHCITDNAIIIIQNFFTKKIITKLIARPGQIRRYWLNLYGFLPKNSKIDEICDIAQQHKNKRMNNW